MSQKITRSTAKPKSQTPQFPSRHLKAVAKPAAPPVEPINTVRVKAHYTTHGWLMWGIMGLCMAMGALFSQQIIGAVQWVRIEANERTLAEIGREVCQTPLLTVPEYTCTVGELDCWTVPQEAVIKRYEQQARARNLWQAERCVPLMP